MIKHEAIRFRDYSRISVDCKNPKATQLIVKGEKHESLVAWTAIMIRNISDLISALANNTSTTLKLTESIRDKSINIGPWTVKNDQSDGESMVVNYIGT